MASKLEQILTDLNQVETALENLQARTEEIANRSQGLFGGKTCKEFDDLMNAFKDECADLRKLIDLTHEVNG